MSTEKERAPVTAMTDADLQVGNKGDPVTSPAESFTCGSDGRITVTHAEPKSRPVVLKEQRHVCIETEQPDNRPQWLKTVRKGSGPRWKNNRRSGGFGAPEMVRAIELNAWRVLFAATAIMHLFRIH